MVTSTLLIIRPASFAFSVTAPVRLFGSRFSLAICTASSASLSASASVYLNSFSTCWVRDLSLSSTFPWLASTLAFEWRTFSFQWTERGYASLYASA